MTAYQILKNALSEMGADGLVNLGLECGCSLDDFIPCDGLGTKCVPGVITGKRGASCFRVANGDADADSIFPWLTPMEGD